MMYRWTVRRAKIAIVLAVAIALTGCSYGYEVVIVNDSEETVEVVYKIGNQDVFDDPMVKSLNDWNSRKGIHNLWEDEKPWQPLASNFVTDPDALRRIVKIGPKQAVKIESGTYNPIQYDEGRLTNIVELKIVTRNGEVTYKGKLVLSEFEKDGYTFIKTYKNELKGEN